MVIVPNILFQSTLPRGERRRLRLREHGRKSISIHAPARGATFCHLLALLNTRNFNPRSREGSDGHSDVTLLTVPVFQSTLPRGERHLPQTRCPENVYFNPRSREGSDVVSYKIESVGREFQSTLPRGERRLQDIRPPRTMAFQSTLPRGERRRMFPPGIRPFYFNPRSREGSDHRRPYTHPG